jgi:hypothetical protein
MSEKVTKFEKYMQDPETMGGKFQTHMVNVMKERGRAILEREDRLQNERSQKQYEAQDKQEGRKMKSGGKVSSASSRADGCATKGKTKGRMV